MNQHYGDAYNSINQQPAGGYQPGRFGWDARLRGAALAPGRLRACRVPVALVRCRDRFGGLKCPRGTTLLTTVPPGQATGWHYHDGTLYARVKQGTLSHFDATCASSRVHPEGSTLQEPPGADHVHLGRNLGTTDLELQVLYVLPHGAPFSQDAPNPGCDFE